VRSSELGALIIILGVILFGVLLDSLFLPLGVDTPPIMVGVMTISLMVVFVAAIVRKS
jgi:hypothetical protein